MPGGIQPPIEQLLHWPTPNYINPPTQTKYVLVLSCTIGPISLALLMARIWVRVRIQRNAGVDDWLMLASVLPVTGLTTIIPFMVENLQFNRHVWDVEPRLFPLQRKFIMATYCLFTLSSGLIKLSVILFYRRLSERAISPVYLWILRAAILSIIGHTIAFAIVPIFACTPISAFWDQVNFEKKFQPGGYRYRCINEGADLLANGIISTVQDFVVALLPSLLCWNLKISLRQKLALYGVFATSYTTIAIGAMRTYMGYRIFFETYDVTWLASEMWLWTLLEIHIGSICANTPALKVFFSQIWASERFSSWTRSWSQSRSNKSQRPSAGMPQDKMSFGPKPNFSFDQDSRDGSKEFFRTLARGPPYPDPEYADTIISARPGEHGSGDVELWSIPSPATLHFPGARV